MNAPNLTNECFKKKKKSEGNNNMWWKDEKDVISDGVVEEDNFENNI